MKKQRFLQLGLGFGVTIDTYNSMYLYILSVNGQVATIAKVALNTLVSYTILYMGASTLKWTTPNSFVPFKRARTWNWKLKWHANNAQNLWFNHIFDFYNIYIYIYLFIFYLFIFFELHILNFTVYLYINSNDDLKPCKV